MRKLPIYLLLDTSGSMHGEPIEAVKNGVEMLVSTLRNDPYALETAYLSVITFNTNAQQLVPLTELEQFQTPVINHIYQKESLSRFGFVGFKVWRMLQS